MKKAPPMISNSSLIFYACIAKGHTIIAEFNREPGIEAIAQLCVEQAPSHHSMFSHTARKRSYTFLMNDSFDYFAIFDVGIEKSESLWFLNRVKNAFEEFMASDSIVEFDKFTPLCFQGEFYPLFREILAVDLEMVNSLEESERDRNASLDFSTRDSRRGKQASVKPLLAKPSKVWCKKKKKKKRLFNGFGVESNGDRHVKDGDGEEDALRNGYLDESGNVVGSRGYSVSMIHKSGGAYSVDSRQKAEQIWRKHVWVVLMVDLIVCAALFGIWLWVCGGFQCIDG